MASNALPEKLGRLFPLCDNMIIGLTLLEATLSIKQNTKLVMEPALAAGRGAEAAFGAAKVAKKAATAGVVSADVGARLFITNARKRLSKFFGESYNAEWEGAGWPNSSTEMPDSQDERFNLISDLKTYFTNHPEHESADMDATAAIATTVWGTLNTARGVLAQKVTDMGTAKTARDTAVKNLRKRMQGLIGELETLLGPEDPRWHSFGLSRPADEETPAAPSFTTLVPGLAGTLLGDWDDALRADHYRVWILIVGTDTEFHAVDNPEDSDITLSGLPSGATVKMRVTSVNGAGESVPGPEAQAVVP